MNDDLPPPEGDMTGDTDFVLQGYEALYAKVAERNMLLVATLRRVGNVLGPVAELASDGGNHANGCPAFSMSEDGGVKTVAPELCVCTLRPILLAYREVSSALNSLGTTASAEDND